MNPIFVKVRPCVAVKLKLAEFRTTTADGSYILRPSDLFQFGPAFMLPETAAKIGGVILSDPETAAEQRGQLTTPLPDPTDPEWLALVRKAEKEAGKPDKSEYSELSEFSENSEYSENSETSENSEPSSDSSASA